MLDVYCQKCGRKVEMNADYLEEFVAHGEIVTGQRMTKKRDSEGQIFDTYVDLYFDLCKTCSKAVAVTDKTDPTVLQTARIRHRIHLLHESEPSLSERQCRAKAIREEFDPTHEPNPAFRAFLVEREGHKVKLHKRVARQILKAVVA